MKNISISTYKTLALSAILMAAVFVIVPKQAYAFDFGRIIDPLCIFACDDEPKRVTKNVTTIHTTIHQSMHMIIHHIQTSQIIQTLSLSLVIQCLFPLVKETLFSG